MSSLRMLNHFNTCRGLGHTACTLRIGASLSPALKGYAILVLTYPPAAGRLQLAEREHHLHFPTLATDILNRFPNRLRKRPKTTPPSNCCPVLAPMRLWGSTTAQKPGLRRRRRKVFLDASQRGHARQGSFASATKQV